jgi:hypothetical protein
VVAIDRDGVAQHPVDGLQIPGRHRDGDEDLRIGRLYLSDVFEVIVPRLNRSER